MPPPREQPPAGTAAGYRGEQAAAEAFAREALAHLDALYAFACRLAESPADAEDLVQETMLNGLRARTSFQPGTNLKAWLFTILRRTFLNRRARSGPAPMGGSTDLEHLPEAAVDPEPVLFAAVSRGALDAALAALPLAYREAVWLVDVEELTVAEAASVLGCPIGTVKSRTSRGRALLRASLRDYAR